MPAPPPPPRSAVCPPSSSTDASLPPLTTPAPFVRPSQLKADISDVANVVIECGMGEQVLRWLAYAAVNRLAYLSGASLARRTKRCAHFIHSFPRE